MTNDISLGHNFHFEEFYVLSVRASCLLTSSSNEKLSMMNIIVYFDIACIIHKNNEMYLLEKFIKFTWL